MSKPKAEKSGNRKKPKIPQKAPALPVDKASEKPILPSIFVQGKDEKTVFIKVDSDEAFKSLKESLGTENPHLWQLFLDQLGRCGDKRKGMADNLNELIPILYSIKPKDVLEGMLAVQMTGIHNVAMYCLGAALNEGQTFMGRDANINWATRLLRMFTAQMEALQKYRGKSTQQKVTVEHVHVHQGGQAIVGAVNHQGKGGGGGDESQS
jgi:hypothetical protein